MLEQFKRMASSAFDILLDTHDIPKQVVDTGVQSEKKLCGLWLAFRRGALNLTSEQVAHRTGLDPVLITLLETGLVVAKLLPQDMAQGYQWRQLALALENKELHDFDSVMAVINIGLGIPTPDRIEVLKQVCNELAIPIEHLQALALEDEISTVLADTPQSAEETTDMEFGFRPTLRQVLVALAHEASTALEIKKEIAARTENQISIGIHTINRILQGLHKGTFILISGKTRYGGNIYTLTTDGAEIAKAAVHLEKQHVEVTKQHRRVVEQVQKLQEQLEEQHVEVTKQHRRVAEQVQKLQEQQKATEEETRRITEEERRLYERVQLLSLAS